jgi:hypothetical protein
VASPNITHLSSDDASNLDPSAIAFFSPGYCLFAGICGFYSAAVD